MNFKLSKTLLPTILYKALSGQTIQLVGQLIISEIFALLYFPFLRFKLFTEIKPLQQITILFGILLFGQIISDLVNNSEPGDYLRGWAVVIFTTLTTLFLISVFSSNYKNVLTYLAVGALIQLFFGTGDLDLSIQEENTNYFKIRFVNIINPLIMLFSYYLIKLKLKKTIIPIFFVYALISFTMDARSNGLGYFIATLILFIKFSNVKISTSKFIAFSVFTSCLLYFAYMKYADMVIYDDFGGSNSKEQMAKMNNPYNPFELLTKGRSDVFVAMEAIKDSPIFGHGSWAKDKTGKYANLLAKLSGNDKVNLHSYIPSHSILAGAYLNSGLLGFLSIMLVYIVLSRIIIICLRDTNSDYYAILLSVVVKFYWDMLFSPYSGIRISLPPQIAIILAYYYTQYLSPKKLLLQLNILYETSNNNTSKN